LNHYGIKSRGTGQFLTIAGNSCEVIASSNKLSMGRWKKLRSLQEYVHEPPILASEVSRGVSPFNPVSSDMPVLEYYRRATIAIDRGEFQQATDICLKALKQFVEADESNRAAEAY